MRFPWRIAGVLHMFNASGAGSNEVDAETMGRALSLSRFYLDEALRLFGSGIQNTDLGDANRPARWLRDKWFKGELKPAQNRINTCGNADEVTVTEIVQYTRIVKKTTRTAKKLMAILEEQTGCAMMITNGPMLGTFPCVQGLSESWRYFASILAN